MPKPLQESMWYRRLEAFFAFGASLMAYGLVERRVIDIGIHSPYQLWCKLAYSNHPYFKLHWLFEFCGGPSVLRQRLGGNMARCALGISGACTSYQRADFNPEAVQYVLVPC